MTKYLLLISLIVAGAGVATAGKPSSGGSGCRHSCSLAYQAEEANCAATWGTGTTNTAYQQCAQQAVADYYSCVSFCH